MPANAQVMPGVLNIWPQGRNWTALKKCEEVHRFSTLTPFPIDKDPPPFILHILQHN